MLLFLILHFAFLAAASFSDLRTPPLCGNPFPLTSANLDVFEGLTNGSINAEQGSSDILNMQNYGGPREWPRNDQNKVVIQYCFETQDARDKIGRQFRDYGIGEWLRVLGGAASSDTGHGLVFEETQDELGQPLFCQDPQSREWNKKIDYNAVMVRWSYEKHFVGSSTIGFVGFVSGDPPVPGIHKIAFGERYIYPTMVHELGHTLGMAHEHQRKDRDSSVSYRCHNVQDFYEIFERFRQSEKPDATWSDLCDNIANALKMQFRGADLVRGYSGGDPRWRENLGLVWEVADYGEPYDLHSVMHYLSDAFKADNLICLRGLTNGCTLVNNLQGHEKEYLPRNFRPSEKDIKWIKRTYPWIEPPRSPHFGGMNGTSP